MHLPKGSEMSSVPLVCCCSLIYETANRETGTPGELNIFSRGFCDPLMGVTVL